MATFQAGAPPWAAQSPKKSFVKIGARKNRRLRSIKRFAVDRGLVAGNRFLCCQRAPHDAPPRAGRLANLTALPNFRVARNPSGIRRICKNY